VCKRLHLPILFYHKVAANASYVLAAEGGIVVMNITMRWQQ